MGAGRLAPSASSARRQKWRLVVVTDGVTKRKIAEAANNQRFVGGLRL